MSKMIIYVDDNIQENDALINSIRREGFKIKIINDSKEAIPYLQSNPYDILIIDLDMHAGMPSGKELIESIRRFNKITPIIIVSNVLSEQEIPDWQTFINNNTNAVFSTDADNAVIINKIREISNTLDSSLKKTLEEWLEEEHNPNDVLLASKNGKKYTVKEILDAIRKKTSTGMEFEKNLNKLTIDLLTRKIEKIE